MDFALTEDERLVESLYKENKLTYDILKIAHLSGFNRKKVARIMRKYRVRPKKSVQASDTTVLRIS